MTLNFDFIETLTLASVLYWLGVELCRRLKPLARYNIPPVIVGGLIFSLLRAALAGSVTFKFDLVLMQPFMVVFFATIGLGASAALLKRGGGVACRLLIAAAVLLVLQNAVSLGLGRLLGLAQALALLAGSATMTGGHGTGYVFARTVTEVFGLSSAAEVAMACATFGVVAGSLIGGPLAERLIRRNHLAQALPAGEYRKSLCPDVFSFGDSGEKISNHSILMTIFQICFAASVGIWAEGALAGLGVTFPGYAAALVTGAVMRNIGDHVPLFRVRPRIVRYISGASLSFFLALALMSMDLVSLSGLGLPLLAIMLAQTALMVVFAWFVTFRMTGGDYQAAVVSAGHCGFGVGVTPNAIANMEAVCAKYGMATDAFFAVAAVGAFFIDLVNVFAVNLIIYLLR